MKPLDIVPTEFNIIIELDASEEKSPGGIILLTQTKEADKLAADEGTLVAVSPHAFTYADWPDGARMPQVGERVIFARYAGKLLERGGRVLRIIKDKDLIAIVDEPVAVAQAA